MLRDAEGAEVVVLDDVQIAKLRGKPEPLADLLDEVESFVKLRVVCTAEQMTVIVLWILHTYVYDVFDTTPYLDVTSPERECGKTELLLAIEALACNAVKADNMSDAVLFRGIQTGTFGTVLLDEVDALFGKGAKDREDTRGMLNAGYRRGGMVYRCAPKTFEIEGYSVFCPKGFSGIGHSLPDTLRSRSIEIRMQRMNAADPGIPRMRTREVNALAVPLKEKLVGWAESARDAVAAATPKLPERLGSRELDCWEPLFNIAEVAGGGWPGKIRAACKALIVNRAEQSHRVELLTAIYRVFEASPHLERISTEDLIRTLASDEEAWWAGWWDSVGETIAKGKARTLGGILHEFGIPRSKDFRFPNDVVKKGYLLEWFVEPFTLYVIPYLPESATSATSATNVPQSQADVAHVAHVAHFQGNGAAA